MCVSCGIDRHRLYGAARHMVQVYRLLSFERNSKPAGMRALLCIPGNRHRCLCTFICKISHGCRKTRATHIHKYRHGCFHWYILVCTPCRRCYRGWRTVESFDWRAVRLLPHKTFHRYPSATAWVGFRYRLCLRQSRHMVNIFPMRRNSSGTAKVFAIALLAAVSLLFVRNRPRY